MAFLKKKKSLTFTHIQYLETAQNNHSLIHWPVGIAAGAVRVGGLAQGPRKRCSSTLSPPGIYDTGMEPVTHEAAFLTFSPLLSLLYCTVSSHHKIQ